MTKKVPLLRNYQQDIVSRVHQEWKHHRSVMVQMPTGTGKTHVLASIVSAFRGNVLIVAHRRELVEQIKETVFKFNIKNKRLRVFSIQTIYKNIDNLDFSPELIVIDEAHHALAKTYRILWDKWPQAKILGLTATPCRMNHAGFRELFDTLVSSWSIAEFIRKGILSVFDYAAILPGSSEQQLIDSLQKKGTDGDFQIKEMESLLNKRPNIERLYLSLMQFAQGKKGIVYAISISHARKIAEYYNIKGIKSVAIDSKTSKEERCWMVDAFKKGEVQVLVNVDIFSEGFDCPDVEFVQMARPTLSLSKYLQQVGRGVRKSKGKKSCILIDNVGLCHIFGLPVQRWNWEKMFRGEVAGKGIINQSRISKEGEYLYRSTFNVHETSVLDAEIGLILSHKDLLDRLHELENTQRRVEENGKLSTWQDVTTFLWGLKRGKKHITQAEYLEIFDIKNGVIAVRFKDGNCGLVNENGAVLWRGKNELSMRIMRDKFVEIKTKTGKTNYLDLYNLKIYLQKPEIKRYGDFELLKVEDSCYSRTKIRYASKVLFGSLVIIDKNFLLSIYESACSSWDRGEARVCILKNDAEEFYHIQRWLPDGSVVISDMKGHYYHATKDGKKNYLEVDTNNGIDRCQRKITLLERSITEKQETKREERKQKLCEEFQKATPYQAGIKWGLKIGERITIPPIYRNMKPPVGKYCAVEMNHSQWGIVSIDGTILVEPKYPEVTIETDGTALLTQVTGNKIKITLK